MAPPMSGGAPRLYGGAGPDAAQALKYLSGKQPDLPSVISGKSAEICQSIQVVLFESKKNLMSNVVLNSFNSSETHFK